MIHTYPFINNSEKSQCQKGGEYRDREGVREEGEEESRRREEERERVRERELKMSAKRRGGGAGRGKQDFDSPC